jgi:predicted amidohydrolase
MLIAGPLAVVLAACVTPLAAPTRADLMRAQAVDAQAAVDQRNRLADDWEEGSRVARLGEQQIREGEMLIREGETMIEDAEGKIVRGRELVEQGAMAVADGDRRTRAAEGTFRATFPALLPELEQETTP